MKHVKRDAVELDSGLFIPASGNLYVPVRMVPELDEKDREELSRPHLGHKMPDVVATEPAYPAYSYQVRYLLEQIVSGKVPHYIWDQFKMVETASLLGYPNTTFFSMKDNK